LRGALGKDTSPDSLENIRFEDAGCGPSAVLVITSVVTGEVPRLDDLLEQVPIEERELGETSVHTLQRLLASLGIFALPVRYRSDRLPDIGVPMIVQTTHRNEELHFEVAVRTAHGVLTVTPPRRAVLQTDREFAARWTGVGLLVSDDRTDAIEQLSMALLVAGAIVLTAALLFSNYASQRKRSRPEDV
jgi:hypothetical protein